MWLSIVATIAGVITAVGLVWGRRPQQTTKEKIERAAQLAAAYETLEAEIQHRT